MQLVSNLKNKNTSRKFPSKYARSMVQDLVRNRLRRTTAPRTFPLGNLLFPTTRHFPKDSTDKFSIYLWLFGSSISQCNYVRSATVASTRRVCRPLQLKFVFTTQDFLMSGWASGCHTKFFEKISDVALLKASIYSSPWYSLSLIRETIRGHPGQLRVHHDIFSGIHHSPNVLTHVYRIRYAV